MSDDEPKRIAEAVNGFSGLYPRHKGGHRYSVLSLRNDTNTRHWVTLGEEPSCTCGDYEYNTDGTEVCDHIATAEHSAPGRISVEENFVSDLSGIVRDFTKATESAETAAKSVDTVLARLRDVEADVPLHPSESSPTASKDTEEPDRPSVHDTTPMVDPPEAAEKLQEAYDRVTDDMKVELSGDLVWVKTGFDTPDTLDVMGSPETWPTLIKNADHVQYDPDHAKAPGEYFKNYIEPDAVEDYISEVLE